MTSEKFILVGLDDEKSSYVAEVLKNKTCKKILDFLGDRKEASEKDISDGLDIPINTAEYNLKKLIKSGLIEKTKNFFWSVKGKKIPMYKLARKYIIICPGKKPSLNYIKSILPVIIAALLVAIIAFVALYPEDPTSIDIDSENILRQFNSQKELNGFIEQSIEARQNLRESFGILDWIGGIAIEDILTRTTGIAMAETAAVSGAGNVASDYSTTNIQVEGVDEADIVKNDGKYIYVVSGSKVIIVNAYPAEDMEVLSEIKFDENVGEIFINKDKLVVFSGAYYGRSFENIVYVYDISDKEEPELESEIKLEGNYIDSRMIGDYVYVISNKYINNRNPEPPVYYIDGIKESVAASDVYYFDYPDTNYVFSSISAINLENGEFNQEVYLTGGATNIYVSQNNIYLTYMKRASFEEYAEEIAKEVYFPLLSGKYGDKIQDVLDLDKALYIKLSEMREVVDDYPQSLESDEFVEFSKELSEKLEDFEVEVEKKNEKTVVHKINIDKGDIEYKGSGEVPGHVLNQFSMDEYKGKFRIATTTGNTGRFGSNSLNHLYILDEDLEIIGKVEDLAKGEKIYSVRFMGKRAYIVTFKKVDPLFVIDVSNPEDPEVLGYLKITGYSDYLHPYDENHIIGIGKETIASEIGDFAWYQGVKVSLFDVSDVENPVEISKIEIGDRGTDSEALRNHKAILFDKEKNLLVLPINLYEIDKSKYAGDVRDNAYGEFVWQGAFVLDISLDGIKERGRITHDEEAINPEKRYYKSRDNIQRSLYMDDILYTISSKKIKANDLNSLNEINFVKWAIEDKISPVYYDL